MSLGEYNAGSPSHSSFHSPGHSGDWLTKDFTDDFFLESSLDQPLTLTPEEEKLFRCLGESPSLGNNLSLEGFPDPIDDRQVIMAAAAAAGLNKGGIRRAAFSMGDLQALQPPEEHSPRPLPPRGSGSTVGASRPPRLESVPENKSIAAETSSLVGHLPTRVSDLIEATPSGILSEGLDSVSMEQMHSDLLTNHADAFGTDVSMFDSSNALPERHAGMPMSGPEVKLEPNHMPMTTPSMSHAVPPLSLGGSGPYYGYSYMNGASEAGPSSLSMAVSSSFTAPMVETEQAKMLRGYADELLGAANPPLRNPAHQPSPRDAKEAKDVKDRFLRRSQSAVELRSLGGMPRHGSTGDLRQMRQVTVELTTPEGHTYTVGRLSNEDRAQKILRYRQKRHERNFNKRIKYMCRKTLADSRPRVRGRFARNDDAAAVMPHETKKALAEKARKETKKAAAAAAAAAANASKANAVRLAPTPGFSPGFTGLIPDPGGPSYGQLPLPPSSQQQFIFTAGSMPLYARPPRPTGPSSVPSADLLESNGGKHLL